MWNANSLLVCVLPLLGRDPRTLPPMLDGQPIEASPTAEAFVRDVTIHLVTSALVQSAQRVADDDVRGRAPRVRSEHAVIARLITQATERSTTFRREIDVINRTDGLIYVHEGRCRRGVWACLMLTVELAGPYRLLRVKLDLRRSELNSMAAIGHELQHAIEALSDPHVTSNRRIFSFFQQLAPTGSDTFETTAAVRAGDDVFGEVRAYATRLSSIP